MRPFIRAALVIARRDYLETVLSFSFLAFLMAPVFMLGIAELSKIAAGDSDLKAMRPIVAIIGTDDATRPLLSAHEGLRHKIALKTWPVIKRVDPGTDVMAQAASLLDNRHEGVNAVIVGYPEKPRLLGSPIQIADLIGRLNLAQQQVDAARLLSLHGLAPPPARIVPEVFAASDVGAGAGRLLLGRGLQMMMFFAIFLQGGLLLSSLNEEKKSRILDTLLTAVTVEALLVGKVLAMLGSSLTILFCWATLGEVGLLVMAKASNILVTPAIGWPLFVGLGGLYFVLGYMAYGAILIGLAGFANNARQIQLISLPLSALQFIIFICASAAINNQGTTLAYAAQLFPLSASLAMAGSAAVDGSLWQHGLALLWILAWVIVLFWISAKLFKRGVLQSS